jgi:hypothetical protein
MSKPAPAKEKEVPAVPKIPKSKVRARRRLTVEIDPGLDDTLEMYCVAHASTKNAVTSKALSVFLNTQKETLLEHLKKSMATF